MNYDCRGVRWWCSGALVVAGLVTGSIAVAQTSVAYAITKSVPLGAPDRWDYVVFDPSSHRVFVSHGDRVTVVDGQAGTILGEVTGFPGGTHGIAIVVAAGRGYTDDGEAGEAASFDLKTLKALKRIKTDADADGIVFDTASGHVFVINGDSGTLTAIDPGAERAVATIRVGGKLEFAASGGDGKLYVNGMEKRELVRIDTRTNQVEARWPISHCERPHGLAIDPQTHRLFASCVNNTLMVVNADTGAVVTMLAIGRGSDAAVFDPRRRLVFSSNGQDGTLSIIQEKDAQTFVALDSVKTVPTARTMSLDPDSGRIYLVAGELQPEQTAAPSGRRAILAGSVKLLFLDPQPAAAMPTN